MLRVARVRSYAIVVAAIRPAIDDCTIEPVRDGDDWFRGRKLMVRRDSGWLSSEDDAKG